MPPIRKRPGGMTGCLPEAEQIPPPEIGKEALPDDIATADGLAAIQAAQEEYARGETVPHEAIHWD